ncbi:hypothetical protein [Streptomyces sp. NPDC059631]|uniref:hypothetical protein n=1 Tax=unclassified Streptomyces TaxID=2593676 RepID=UPI00369A85A0
MATSLKAVTDCLRATLAASQEQRQQRPDLIEGPAGTECAWVSFERARMHETVNEIRAEHGLPPVPLEEILRVEQQAVGHSDYSQKFAFYCAELVVQ